MMLLLMLAAVVTARILPGTELEDPHRDIVFLNYESQGHRNAQTLDHNNLLPSPEHNLPNPEHYLINPENFLAYHEFPLELSLPNHEPNLPNHDFLHPHQEPLFPNRVPLRPINKLPRPYHEPLNPDYELNRPNPGHHHTEHLRPNHQHLRPDPEHLRPNPEHLGPNTGHLRPDPEHLRPKPEHLRPNPANQPILRPRYVQGDRPYGQVVGANHLQSGFKTAGTVLKEQLQAAPDLQYGDGQNEYKQYGAGQMESKQSGATGHVELCTPYLQNVLDTIELLDAKNATCKAQYLDLRKTIAERGVFDLCLETVLIKDEVLSILAEHKGRDGRFFGIFGMAMGKLFGLGGAGLAGGEKKDDSNALEMNLNVVNSAFSSREYCEPREFCRSCARTGKCCRRFCERMWYDSSLEDYSCSSDYCSKHTNNSNCSKCDHCNCRQRYGNY